MMTDTFAAPAALARVVFAPDIDSDRLSLQPRLGHEAEVRSR